MSARMQLFTGILVNPLALTVDDIRIHDIAHALSQINRYGGHAKRTYSVAEHSVLVHRIVKARGGSLEDERWALLHDASEAYLGDVVRGLKRSPVMEGYRVAEARAMDAVATRFGLRGGEPLIVRQADRDILGNESAALFDILSPGWEWPKPAPELAGYRDWGLSPFQAETRFMQTYEELFDVYLPGVP